MKAAITPTYGSPNVIEIRDIPKPEIGACDVLVSVHASPVTEGDRRLRSADFPGFTAVPGRLAMGIFAPRQHVQGTMFSGRVVAAGSDVTRFVVGDDVFGSVAAGAFAEFLAVPEDSVIAKKPQNVSHAEAAATPYGAITALHFLRDVAKVETGDRVLILGASGGVGRYAVQIAKYLGADVTGVCSPSSIELVRELGADQVIDYTTEDFSTNGETYDVIFDIADATTFSHSQKSLTSMGRYVTLYASLRVVFNMLFTSLRRGRKALFSIAIGTRSDVLQIQKWLETNVIHSVVGKHFPLDRIADAHAAIDNGHRSASLVVAIR